MLHRGGCAVSGRDWDRAAGDRRGGCATDVGVAHVAVLTMTVLVVVPFEETPLLHRRVGRCRDNGGRIGSDGRSGSMNRAYC